MTGIDDRATAGSIGSSSAARAAGAPHVAPQLPRAPRRPRWSAARRSRCCRSRARPRASRARAVARRRRSSPAPSAIRQSCDYWRHCAIDGFLCACCGGSQSACPPGTEMSPITWIGTCRNPGDGKDYVISYNDCCGAVALRALPLHPHRGRAAVYYTSKNNDLLWCFGTKSRAVHCSVAIVLGRGDGVVSAAALARRWSPRRRALVGAGSARGRAERRLHAQLPGLPPRRRRGHAGQRAAARATRSRASSPCRAAASTSCRCPASRRRRSTTRRSPRCSTGCSRASTAPTCRPASRRTPPRRSAACARSRSLDVDAARARLLAARGP